MIRVVIMKHEDCGEVDLCFVGAPGDPRPWRVQQPGSPADGWLLARDDFTVVSYLYEDDLVKVYCGCTNWDDIGDRQGGMLSVCGNCGHGLAVDDPDGRMEGHYDNLDEELHEPGVNDLPCEAWELELRE